MLELRNINDYIVASERVKNDTNGNPIYQISIFKINCDSSGLEYYTNCTNQQKYGKIDKNGILKIQAFNICDSLKFIIDTMEV